MKTNQNMVRKMGNFKVIQRTKDGMFNATDLINQWNKNPNNPKRELKKFWIQDSVKDFIQTLITEENLDGPSEAYVKSKASRGANAGTWLHPLLFIKFAMWLNPKFEYYVIRFIYDQLIEYRHSAGDNYKILNRAASKFKNVDYPTIAKALNYIVFGKHDKELRQHATKEQLDELTRTQQNLSHAIDTGLINSYDSLIKHMRKMYYHKWNQKAIYHG